jgi:hypothetical protein
MVALSTQHQAHPPHVVVDLVISSRARLRHLTLADAMCLPDGATNGDECERSLDMQIHYH